MDMHFSVVGVSHKNTSVNERSVLSIPYNTLASAYASLSTAHPNLQCVILSTCNRIELYLWGEYNHALIDWLHHFSNQPLGRYNHHFYRHENTEAITHAIRVSSGLESMVMGEPEIFGQMKKAFARAKDYGNIRSECHFLFQRIFSATKAIRSQTAIGHCPVSFGCTALRLLADSPEKLSNASILLIGAGQTIQLVAKHLHTAGIANITIANRTLTRARELAESISANCLSLNAIKDHLHTYDIIITATHAKLPLITKDMVCQAMMQRKSVPMTLLDMGVPRNIQQEANSIDNVTLYCVDDINTLVQHNTLHRTRAAITAQTLIEQHVASLINRFSAEKESNALIKKMRLSTQALADEQLEAALAKLESGMPARDVIHQLTQNLTNKWLHQPSTQLANAHKSGNNALLSVAEQLFIQDDH